MYVVAELCTLLVQNGLETFPGLLGSKKCVPKPTLVLKDVVFLSFLIFAKGDFSTPSLPTVNYTRLYNTRNKMLLKGLKCASRTLRGAEKSGVGEPSQYTHMYEHAESKEL